MGFTMRARLTSPAQGPSGTRPPPPCIGDRLRAIELGLQKCDLCIQDVGARRDAGAESVADDTPCLARASNGIVRGSDRRARGLELARALSHFDGHDRVE